MEPVLKGLSQLNLTELVEMHYIGSEQLAIAFKRVQTEYDKTREIAHPKGQEPVQANDDALRQQARILGNAVILAKAQVELWLAIDKLIGGYVVKEEERGGSVH